MAAKMVGVLVAVALAVAVASQTAEASPNDDYELFDFCARVHRMVKDEPASWADSITAYKTAMKYVKSFGSQFSLQRRGLAKAWRAVTYDEPCSSKSLAYVHLIGACKPRYRASQKHLEEDVRKYAKKCLTVDSVGEELKKYASADVEKFLTKSLLSAYRREHQGKPWFSCDPIHINDNCCTPKEASEMVAELVRADFPQEAKQIKRSSDLVGEFLTKHLYKPCANYVKRVDKIMEKIDATSFYALGDDVRRLPEDIRDTIFRFKFCQKLEDDLEKYGLNVRVGVSL